MRKFNFIKEIHVLATADSVDLQSETMNKSLLYCVAESDDPPVHFHQDFTGKGHGEEPELYTVISNISNRSQP